jgi:hypothetical protein
MLCRVLVHTKPCVYSLRLGFGRNVLNAANMNIDQKQHPCAHNQRVEDRTDL